MTVERDILRGWYHHEPDVGYDQMINPDNVQAFFGVHDLYEDMIHVTTEDPDEISDVGDWIHHLIMLAPLPVPYIAPYFDLHAGGIGGEVNGLPYVRYLAGNGNFDSSFPLLIYLVEDHVALQRHRALWRMARANDLISDPSEAATGGSPKAAPPWQG